VRPAVASGKKLLEEVAMDEHRPPPLVIQVRSENRGRVTGWSVRCDDHGVMPVLAPGKSAALIAAGRHLETEHAGRGRVVLAGERKSA
jgi:hypothetical protein